MDAAWELFRRRMAENLADHRREMERLLARARRDLAEQRTATADLVGRLEAALEDDRQALDRLHTSLSASLEDLFRAVDDLSRSPGAIPAAGSGPGGTVEPRIAEQLEGLSAQMEALRRRIPLRGRPAAAPLDEATVAAIADAVAERLRAGRPGRSAS